MFLSVQRTLQISLFLYCCCPVRSPLFRGVVVKLSSTGVTSKLAFYNRRGLCSTAVTDKKVQIIFTGFVKDSACASCAPPYHRRTLSLQNSYKRRARWQRKARRTTTPHSPNNTSS